MRLLVYCTEISNNLNLASRNIRNLAIKKTYDLDPIDLLKFDRIIMTKEAVVKIT
jgi:large subunit ribosomal protein L4